MRCAEREGILEKNIEGLACCKVNALEKLGRFPEMITFLREVVARFPDVAMLHYNLSAILSNILSLAGKDVHHLSVMLYGVSAREKGALQTKDVLEEAVSHALTAAQLAPEQYRHVSCASVMLRSKGDYASALRYGKQALSLASTNKEKIDALQEIAVVYMANRLYTDARIYLRDAMKIDECNVDGIAAIAHCFYMEDNDARHFGWLKAV